MQSNGKYLWGFFAIYIFKDYFFKAVLGLKQIKRKVQRFPIIPLVPTHAYIPIINNTLQNGTFITTGHSVSQLMFVDT